MTVPQMRISDVSGKIGSTTPLKGSSFAPGEDAIVKEGHITMQSTDLTMHLMSMEPVANEYIRQGVDVTDLGHS